MEFEINHKYHLIIRDEIYHFIVLNKTKTKTNRELLELEFTVVSTQNRQGRYAKGHVFTTTHGLNTINRLINKTDEHRWHVIPFNVLPDELFVL